MAKVLLRDLALAAGKWTIGLLFAFLLANLISVAALSWFPGLLRSEGALVREAFNKFRRDHMEKGDKFLEWHGVKSIDDVITLWGEFAAVPVRYSPYLQFETTPFEGRHYSVAPGGYRRGKTDGPWPPASDNLNVFMFGGSTTLGETSNDTTIASYLQEELQARLGPKRSVFVYNFGRSSYQSTQEKFLFQQLISRGLVPNIAVFFDGLNDFCFADGEPSNWGTLAHLYNRFHEKSLRQAKGELGTDWSAAKEFATSLPFYRLALAVGARLNAPLQEYPAPASRSGGIQFKDPPPDPKDLEAVMRRYRENVRQIQAVAESYAVKSVFVWQPIPTYKYDLRHHEFISDRLYCHINSKVGYPLMASEVARTPIRGNFYWAADMQEKEQQNLYIDSVHYTAPMSRKIAVFIADVLMAK